MSADHDVVSEEHKPNFKKQNQEFLGTVLLMHAKKLSHSSHLTPCLCVTCLAALQEERMDPPPDFGYDWYKGSGKLKNKVTLPGFSLAPAGLPAREQP